MTPTQARLAAERKERLSRIASRAYQPPQAQVIEATIAVEVKDEPKPAKPSREVEQVKPNQFWFYISDIERPITIKEIQIVTCETTGVRMADMQSARRLRTVVRPRQIAMYLCRHHTSHSMPEIGRRFGGRDHTTIIHACRQIETLMQIDEGIARIVAEIRSKIEERRNNETDTYSPDRLPPQADASPRQDRGASPAG